MKVKMTGREELMEEARNARDTEYKKKGKGEGQDPMKGEGLIEG